MLKILHIKVKDETGYWIKLISYLQASHQVFLGLLLPLLLKNCSIPSNFLTRASSKHATFYFLFTNLNTQDLMWKKKERASKWDVLININSLILLYQQYFKDGITSSDIKCTLQTICSGKAMGVKAQCSELLQKIEISLDQVEGSCLKLA